MAGRRTRWLLLAALLAVGLPLLRDASAAEARVGCGGDVLQAAVEQAGRTPEADVLVLDCPSPYELTQTLVVPAAGGPLTVRAAALTAVTSVQPRQLFLASAPLTLQNLLLTRGLAPASSRGGAVEARAALVLDQVVVDGISSAAAGFEGSAVSATGPLQVVRTSITRSGTGGSTLLTTGPSSAIVNSTFSDNDSDRAVFFQGSGSHRIVNSTLVVKRGHALLANAPTVLVGSVLDREGAAAGTCVSATNVRDGGGNVEDGDACGLQSGSRVDTDPLLGTLTARYLRAPRAGSPAHSAADPGICRQPYAEGGAGGVDARGLQRPETRPCDAGAAETGPLLEVAPALDFGDVPLGGSRTITAFALRNAGDTALQLGTLNLPDAQFEIVRDQCSGGRLAVGADDPLSTCRIDLRFTPAALGAASRVLSVPSDDVPATRQVQLRGNGVAPAPPTTAPPTTAPPTTAPPTTAPPTTAPPTTAPPTTAPPTTAPPTTAPPTTAPPTTAPPTTAPPTTAPPTTAPPTTAPPTTAPPTTAPPTTAPPTTAPPTTAPPTTAPPTTAPPTTAPPTTAPPTTAPPTTAPPTPGDGPTDAPPPGPADDPTTGPGPGPGPEGDPTTAPDVATPAPGPAGGPAPGPRLTPGPTGTAGPVVAPPGGTTPGRPSAGPSSPITSPSASPVAGPLGGGRAPLAEDLKTLDDLDWDPAHLAVNSLLALLLLALLGLPLTVLNNTLDEHRGDLARWLTAARRPFAAVRGRLPRSELSQPTRYLVLAVVSTLIYCFLSPTFGRGSESLVQFFGVFAGIVGSNVLVDVAVATFTYARWRVTSRLVLFPGMSLMAAACVVVSRTVGLRPGLVLGSVGGGQLSRTLTTAECGLRVAARQGIVVVVAVYAWLCYGPVSQAAASVDASFELRVLDAALATAALSGLGGMVFSLLPLRYLDGAPLRAWAPRLWLGMWLAAAFVFVTLLVNPTSEGDEWVGQERYLAGLLAVYLAVAGGVYGASRWYVARRDRVQV